MCFVISALRYLVAKVANRSFQVSDAAGSNFIINGPGEGVPEVTLASYLIYKHPEQPKCVNIDN